METTVKTTFRTGSPAFDHEGFIPETYTCEGANVNPPLLLDNIPEDAKSIAIIMEDRDAPGGVFDHWLIWNIRPLANILENTDPGTEGKNSFGTNNYKGPCPPIRDAPVHFQNFRP